MDNRVPVFVGIDYADQVSQVVMLDADGRQLGTRRLPSDAARFSGRRSKPAAARRRWLTS